jgi:hypothetical protein
MMVQHHENDKDKDKRGDFLRSRLSVCNCVSNYYFT